MKSLKKWSILLMTMALMCLVMGLTGCSGEKKYTVTVKDAFGNPYTTGVIVQFLQDGKQVAIQPCDKEGVAEKKLAKGEYTVALMSTDESISFQYDEKLKLTEKDRELDVIAAYKASGEPTTLHVGGEECDAYNVGVGCTYVDLTADGRNYFLFTPKEAGNYEFSIIDDANVELGYYGAPHFVQSNNVAEVVKNKFTISVSTGMIGTGETGTNIFVLGVDAKDDKAANCVIGIQRLGDAIKTVEDEPWTVYETTSELKAYTLPAGAQIKEFDITSKNDYKMVYNEEDGFYHLKSADGPLVLARLAEDGDYIACFKTMLDRSGVNKYFFDKDGKLEKKEDYSQCLLEYIEYVDENAGVYPLTKDLKYIIQQRGDYAGWWDIDNVGYIFKDADGNNRTDINADIAWLMMCCYIE